MPPSRSLIVRALSVGVIGAGIAGGLALSVGSPAVATAPAAASAPSAAAFDIDAVHSTVIFRIKHMNVAYNYGRFNDIKGTFLLDSANPSASVIDVTVNVDSVDTANADRDKHLRSPDFFSSKEYPTMSFKSTSINKTADDTFEVAGDLTFRGQTKPISVTMKHTGTGPGRRGGEVSGAETTFTIKRSEWGMNFLPGALGDEVTLTVALEGGRK